MNPKREVNKGVLVLRSKKLQEVSTQIEGQRKSARYSILHQHYVMSIDTYLCQIDTLDLYFTWIHHLYAPFKVRNHVFSPGHRYLYFEFDSVCALLGLLLLKRCMDWSTISVWVPRSKCLKLNTDFGIGNTFNGPSKAPRTHPLSTNYTIPIYILLLNPYLSTAQGKGSGLRSHWDSPNP